MLTVLGAVNSYPAHCTVLTLTVLYCRLNLALHQPQFISAENLITSAWPSELKLQEIEKDKKDDNSDEYDDDDYYDDDDDWDDDDYEDEEEDWLDDEDEDEYDDEYYDDMEVRVIHVMSKCVL